MKKFILFLMVVIGLATANCAVSESFKQVSTTIENVAIKGYDTVAYFDESGAVKGNPQFEYAWKGARWLFSSQANMEKFKANPEQYAPQFGGYCSYSVSHGYTADGDPEAWKVVDGKLYLNNNQEVKKKWEAEQPKLIQDGEKNWKEFKTKKPEHKG
jgi:YHS domain-containing protein